MSTILLLKIEGKIFIAPVWKESFAADLPLVILASFISQFTLSIEYEER